MNSLFPRRANLFPPYEPGSNGPLEAYAGEFERWAKRILVLVGLLGLFGTAASYAGWKQWGPATRFDSLTASISAVRDSAHLNARRLDAVERDVRTNLYITCELLRRSQPRALPPQECSDDQQQQRRGR